MIQKKSEDAVSPVIGVMLLLVVTIVLATIVAAFAGGFGTETEPAPATAVDVVGISAWERKHMGFMILPTGGESRYDGQSTIFYDPNTGEEFLKMSAEGNILLGTNTTLHEMYTMKYDRGYGDVYAPSVTITSLHGESLDLSKISVKVYYHHRFIGDGVLEGPLTPLSGTFTPGDTLEIPLSAEMVNHQYPLQSSTVDVIVYYGSHKIAEAENLKVN